MNELVFGLPRRLAERSLFCLEALPNGKPRLESGQIVSPGARARMGASTGDRRQKPGNIHRYPYKKEAKTIQTTFSQHCRAHPAAFGASQLTPTTAVPPRQTPKREQVDPCPNVCFAPRVKR